MELKTRGKSDPDLAKAKRVAVAMLKKSMVIIADLQKAYDGR